MTDHSTAEPTYLPEAVPPTNHGHTLAAWTAMTGVILGALLASLGCLPGVPFALFWAGLAVVVVSCVVGLVMRNMGYGQPRPGMPARQDRAGH
ncbi:HGxxPAAW family protein [Isoptericola sp. AK164]|uniref:HGxxPAAW family protein n=1 Tax=Isoptericola sp. AK164 TaxID=3024246 RepID=UPI0024188D32|nr:HGxxPAAW family protein [Isoptericola sp. AK164]